MSEVVNPYSAPTAVIADVGVDAEMEAIRQDHISVEASLRSVGLLYYLGTIGLIVSGLAMFAGLVQYGLISLVFGVAMGVIGYGLRALKPWVRTPAIILAAIGLLGFPVGTLINGYVLYLLFSTKGRFVFTPEYEAIRRATPHVRYRTSIVVWIFVGFLLLAMAAAVLIPLLSRGN